MDRSFSCRIMREDDEEAVKALVESTFTSFMRAKFWDWKYLQNPVFDRGLVAVAEEKGEVIGVNHWLRRDFKLSGSTRVNAMLAGDIAVDPRYRMKGVGRALMQFLRSSDSAKGRKAGLIYMFANPELRKRFHTPVGRYVPAPDETVLYTKILNWQKVKANAVSFNEALTLGKFGKRLEKVNVLFKVGSSPPLYVGVDGDGVRVDVEGSQRGVDIVISSDMATFSRIKNRKSQMKSLARALLTGKLKTRGRLLKMWSLYRDLWVFKEILSGKIT